MKQITKEITSLSYTVTQYEASDGKIFTYESECQKYEDNLYLKTVKKIDVDSFYPFIDTFYFVNSEETLEVLTRTILGGETKSSNKKEIKVGDWVTVKYDYNPNGADEYDFITLSELQEAFEELKENIDKM